MLIKLIHYNIHKRLDKLGSQDKRRIDPAETDEFLNRATLAWLRDQTDELKGGGAEKNEKIKQNLSTLSVFSPINQPALAPASISNDVYEFRFSSLLYPLYQILKAQINVTKDGCANKKIDVFLTDFDDLNYKLNDVFHSPSYRWNRALGVLGKDSSVLGSKSLFIYSGGDFTITDLELSYIKLPETATIGGYNDINGALKAETQLDLPDEVHDEIIDKTVALIAASMNDPATQLYSQVYNINK